MEYELPKKLDQFEQPPVEPPQPESAPPTPEQETQAEQSKELREAHKQEISSTDQGTRKKFHLPSLRRNPPPIPQTRDEISLKIEKFMEEDMGDAFQRLSPIAQQEFKLKGEQTATKIRDLLKGTHVKAKKIFRLILDWLRLLPGINRFFLEQEAKIKTDKILSLKNRQ
jgi:hypothetical protein